jgi:hypothetical protein
MRLRFSIVTEHILEASLNHSCVTLTHDWFATWQADDLVCLIVDGGVAALGTANGEPRETPIELLDRGLHPFHMSVTYTHRFPKSRRPSVSGRLWKILEEAWGETTDWAFGHLGLLEEQSASDVVGLLERHSTERANSVRATAAAASAARKSAQAEDSSAAESSAPESSAPESAPASSADLNLADTAPADTALADTALADAALAPSRRPISLRPTVDLDGAGSSASEAEASLAKLAAITGCEQLRPDSSAATADASQPSTGAPHDVDAIWVRDGEPVAAFTFFRDEPIEIGLLRIADSLVTAENQTSPLYVVAPAEAVAEIESALTRPVFQSLNLGPRICVIARAAIQELVARTEDLTGHLAPTVIETIAARVNQAA